MSSREIAAPGPAQAQASSAVNWSSFVELTKPRLLLLVIATTVLGYLLARPVPIEMLLEMMLLVVSSAAWIIFAPVS